MHPLKPALTRALVTCLLASLSACTAASQTDEGTDGTSALEAKKPDVFSDEMDPAEAERRIADDPIEARYAEPNDDAFDADITDPLGICDWAKANFALSGTRFLVADLDVRGADGKCKGVKEVLPTGMTRNSEPFAGASRVPASPMVIPPNGPHGCAGQTLSLCRYDETGSRAVTLHARFAISSSKSSPGPGYYAAQNVIKTRHGDRRAQNVAADRAMGGGDERLLMFEGTDPMYNFLNFVPDRAAGYSGETQNGIHRFPGGAEGALGTPASHGCLRTSTNGTRYVRDWTPIGTFLYIRYKGSPIRR